MRYPFFIDRPSRHRPRSPSSAEGTDTVADCPYPEVTPPTVQVTAAYPGNAKVVADTVATPIEQQVNGVERMLT
jgi:Cu/Ag efflux pump CusA